MLDSQAEPLLEANVFVFLREGKLHMWLGHGTVYRANHPIPTW